MKTTKKFFTKHNNQLAVFIFTLIAFDVILVIEKSPYFPIALAISILAIVAIFIQNYYQRYKREQYLDLLNKEIEGSTTSMLTSMPLGLILTDSDGNIVWFNSKLRKLFPHSDPLMGKNVVDLFPVWEWKEIKEGNRQFYKQKIGEKHYQVIYTKNRDTHDADYVFYFIDETKYVDLEKAYKDEQVIFVYLQIDNLEEVLSLADHQDIPFITSEVNRVITTWVKQYDGVLLPVDESNYVAILTREECRKIKEDRFSILDQVRGIEKGNRYPITLSIGINEGSESTSELEKGAKQALELALGRGGDQAVIKHGNSYDFFGGRSKSIQRNSRVKSRVIAQAIAALIKENERIFIMGHRYPDLDAIGAAVGMYRCALNLKKDAYIILNDTHEKQVKELLDNLVEDEKYKFIHSSVLDGRVNKNDLLIIVDTHRQSLVEAPELVEQFSKKVIIDHHRRSADAIPNASLFYLEPYASSASELVTEILQYISETIYIEKKEADALLAGIVLDTKNFIFSTGTRTFDAAAFLRKEGADTLNIRNYFQDDYEESILRSEIISEARIINNDMAISVCKEKNQYIQKIIAQSADALINIKNIKTSFVIGNNLEGETFVSARSDGNINVQVILESIGGGGHLEVAGAQFSNTTLEEVEEKVMKAIDKYLEETK